MKYHKQEFLKSELFYKEFYASDPRLFYYAIVEGRKRNLHSYEDAMNAAKKKYMLHCRSYFKEDILFYNELSKYILDEDGEVKETDEYIFFKVCYYAAKYMEILLDYKLFIGQNNIKIYDVDYDIEFYYSDHMTVINISYKSKKRIYKIHERRNLQLYDKTLFESMQFYFFINVSDTSLNGYLNRKKAEQQDMPEEEVYDELNDSYLYSCENLFQPGILFYDELAENLIGPDGTFEPINEELYAKLHYYTAKYTVISNENYNFFIDERKKFENGFYDNSVAELLHTYLHDAHAVIEYKDKVLQIRYNPGEKEIIFNFYGVGEWQEKEYMKRDLVYMTGELYEESPGLFVYHILWRHLPVDGQVHTDLTIRFNKVIHIE